MHRFSSRIVRLGLAVFPLLLMYTTAAFAQPTPLCGEREYAAGTPPYDYQCLGNSCVMVLEPLPGGQDCICTSASDASEYGCADASGSFGNSPLFAYLNVGGAWRWGLGIGAALAVINVTIAGFQIMASNGDQAKIAQGKERILWSIFGLVLLMFAGVILNFINPNAFAQP